MDLCRWSARLNTISVLQMRTRLRSRVFRQFTDAPAATSRKYSRLHDCDIDAEPLHRYKKGGYHPVHVGDLLNNGRYRIMHKLGWGSYSTVWAARDQRAQTYVAVKILVAEQGYQDRELTILRAIAAARSDQPAYQHLRTMHDHFQLKGPNGTHDCLVLEILGPSVADYVENYVYRYRIPRKVVKNIARQTLLGLCYLHEHEICHGDLHTRNVAFTLSSIQTLQEAKFLQQLGQLEMGPVWRVDRTPLESGMSRYLVRSAAYTPDLDISISPIKIIDFGQAFARHDAPDEFYNPIVLRSPEVVFRDKVDYRMDVWSMGCMLLELVTRATLFDGIMTNPARLVAQILETISDELPERRQKQFYVMDKGPPNEDPYKLQEWLEIVYFDEERNTDLSKEDIAKVGALIRRMLRFEPSARASAQDILQDPWFYED